MRRVAGNQAGCRHPGDRTLPDLTGQHVAHGRRVGSGHRDADQRGPCGRRHRDALEQQFDGRRTGNSEMVAAGATSTTFTVTTQPVQSTTDVTIVASLEAVSRPITLTLRPGPPPRLIALDVPDELIAYEPASGRVILDRPAGAGGVAVSLSSDDTTVTVPALVSVPERATSASFDISTRAPIQTLKVHITASLGADRFSEELFLYHSQAGFAPNITSAAFPDILWARVGPADSTPRLPPFQRSAAARERRSSCKRSEATAGAWSRS